MAKVAAASLFAVFLVSSGDAQSGRKVETTATPVPAALNAVPDYSESKPLKRRPAYVSPSMGEKAGETSNRVLSAAVGAGSEDVIKVDTNLVTIPVSVFDRNGLYIPNLKQPDFKIFEDGKEQEIAYFGTSDKPFTVVLLIDTSPSTEYKIEEIRKSAIAFVDQLQANDKLIVIEFDANIHVLTEVTGDRKRIYKAIGKADFGYGTSLYDAVDFSLRKRLSKIAGRKAIVLFTDGVDTTSEKSGFDSTLNLAEESDSLVFPVYYNTYLETSRGLSSVDEDNTAGTTPAEYKVGEKYLEELALYTGGRVFRPDALPGGLKAAFEGIAEELRRQYNIGYIPVEAGTPGQRKQIRVRINRPNLVLRARDSYIVGSTNAPR